MRLAYSGHLSLNIVPALEAILELMQKWGSAFKARKLAEEAEGERGARRLANTALAALLVVVAEG